MLEKFSLEAQRIISSAESLSFDLSHTSIGCEHFLLAILKIPDNILTIALKKYRITFKSVISDIKAFDSIKKNDIFFMEYDDNFKKLIDDSQKESREFKEDKVSVNVMEIVFLKNLNGICREIFINNKVDINMLLAMVIKNQRRHSELDRIIDLHDLSNIKKDPLIGRSNELQQLVMALKRRNKPNAILVGNPGVGKTAIVEELAQLLSKNKIPGLEGKRIYELDISSVVGGTKYRGEFEEKLKKIIKNVSDDGNAIIFIDEIHNIIKAGGAEGAIDASNILKPYLSRGDIQIIGATTVDEYHTIFEKDKALNRRFQIIYVDPSNKDETLNILNTLKPIYEDYYKLKIADNLTNYIVEVAEEFIPNMSFPDKAIDILDNSCVLAKNELTKENINKMVEKTYNVSISKDKKALLIKEKLEEEILGQNSAIEKIYKEMLKIELGLIEEDKPLTTMLFVGPSGVGKTQSARIIAKEYYKVKDCFIKLDMATYKDVTSLNKLIGSAPGYSNHDEMPAFIKKIKMHPNSLVLLDEIDKACIDVQDFFLNIFDEGYFIDTKNNIIDCKNVIFIMTCNAAPINPISTNKFRLDSNDVKQKNNFDNGNALENIFRPELLNRINLIVNFDYLDENVAVQIYNKYLDKASYKYETTLIHNMKLDVDLKKLKRYGARYIKKLALDNMLEALSATNKN
mgnify:FL=1